MNKRTLLTLVCLVLLGYLYLTMQHLSLNSVLPSRVSVQSLSVFPARTTSDTITGTPTVTAHFINQVLAYAHSPAQGLGEMLYEQGIKVHINPAFALAVFHHESGYGLEGVATLTHNFGNIRCTSGWKCDPTGGYRWYPTWTDGMMDFYRLLQAVYLPQQRTTIATIIPMYAPSQDNNNVEAYIQAIRADFARWQQGQV